MCRPGNSILPISIAFLLALIVNAAPAAAANSIYACVNNSSGTIRIVGASASCANNEVLLVWNVSGTNGTERDQRNDGTDGTDGECDVRGLLLGNQLPGCRNRLPERRRGLAAGDPPVNAYMCNGTNGTDATDERITALEQRLNALEQRLTAEQLALSKWFVRTGVFFLQGRSVQGMAFDGYNIGSPTITGPTALAA